MNFTVTAVSNIFDGIGFLDSSIIFVSERVNYFILCSDFILAKIISITKNVFVIGLTYT